MKINEVEYKFGKNTYLFFSLLGVIVLVFLLFSSLRQVVIQRRQEIIVTCTKVVDITTTNSPKYERFYDDGYVERTSIFSPSIREGEEVVFYEDRHGRVHKKVYSMKYIVTLECLLLFYYIYWIIM